MRRQLMLVAALAAAASGGAQADPEYAFRGFGTVGVTHSSNGDIDYVKGLTGSGVGKTRATDFGLDSMLGVQMDGTLAPQWTVNVQVLSMRNADKTFTPHVEWANLKYTHSPNFSARVGRVGLPVFMVSDYRLVGYANTWVRGPVEVYSLLPISNGDGVDLRYGLSVGDSVLSLQGAYTNTDFKIPSASGSEDAKSKGQLSVAATYETGPLLLRLGYSQSKVEMMPSALMPLVGGLQAVAAAPIPGASAAAGGLLNEFFARETDASFAGLGATYDNGKYLVQAEYTQRRMKRGIISNVDAGYVLGAVRVGKMTPYLFHAMDKTRGPYTNANAEALVSAGMAMGPAGGGIVGLGMAGRGIYAARDLSQTTTALGLRYDFMKNVALKVQYDHVRPDSGGAGGTQPEKSVKNTNLLTINLDFVF